MGQMIAEERFLDAESETWEFTPAKGGVCSMNSTAEEGRKRLEELFARAGVDVHGEKTAAYPSVRNAFAGVLLRGGDCFVWASRDFCWEDLERLSAAVTRQEERVVIFGESLMERVLDCASRLLINHVEPLIVSRGLVIRDAVCVVHRGAIVFIDHAPSEERGVCVLPRASAEVAIYGG